MPKPLTGQTPRKWQSWCLFFGDACEWPKVEWGPWALTCREEPEQGEITPNLQDTSLIICLDEVVVIFREYSFNRNRFLFLNICTEETVISKCLLSSLLQ